MPLPTRTSIAAALRDPRRWRRWGLELLLLIAIVTAVTLWQNRGLPEGAAPSLAGVRTDGSAVKVGAGDTAQLVVFWATWCPVCRAEAGNIEAVAADWPVLSVALQSGGAAEIIAYMTKEGLTVPALVDEDGVFAGLWRVRGVPAHFILDAAGNIRFRVVGYATEPGLRLRLWWARTFPS